MMIWSEGMEDWLTLCYFGELSFFLSWDVSDVVCNVTIVRSENRNALVVFADHVGNPIQRVADLLVDPLVSTLTERAHVTQIGERYRCMCNDRFLHCCCNFTDLLSELAGGKVECERERRAKLKGGLDAPTRGNARAGGKFSLPAL